MKNIIKSIKSLFTRRRPQYGAQAFRVRPWLSQKVADAQYEQMRNRILGIE